MNNWQHAPSRVKRMVNTPLIRWEKRVERMATDERMALSDTAANMAVKLARLSAYISRRLNGGKHADAVKRQNQVARRVRQALGYTYADDEVNF